MPVLRHQLAVYSPIRLRDIGRGAAALVTDRDALERHVSVGLRADYAADRVVLYQSGTAALSAAIRTAIDLTGPERPVALPAFGCYDLATAAVGAACGIALYDLDPHTLGPDPDSLAACFRSGARVGVVTPLYGYPVDWTALESLAAEHGALLIEDAAQGHGARWHGRPLGSLGTVSVLSFGRGKGWTGGGGGALLLRGAHSGLPAPHAADDPGSSVGTLARTLAQWTLGRPALYGIPMAVPGLGLGETRYHEPSPPRPIDTAALATLDATRSLAQREGEHRRINARSMIEELRALDDLTLVTPLPGAEPGYLRLPVRLAAPLRPLADGESARRLGVAGSYPTTLAALEVVRARLEGPTQQWPGADSLVRELVTLPTHSRVRPRERAALLELFRRGGAEERTR